MTKFLLCLCLLGGVAACVAPEAPPPVHSSAPPVARPVASGTTYDDAPLPNRKVGAPNDSVLRLAK